MTDGPRQDLGLHLGLLARLVIAFAIVLIVAGIVWHGITVQVFERIGRDLVQRPSRAMSFRFILQPAMAATAAILDGLRDARAGRAPYFWTVVSNRQKRIPRLREGLNATARIILLGIAMDVIYQIIVFNTFYPAEALIVALLLAFVPYLLIRGVVLRIARVCRGGASADQMQ